MKKALFYRLFGIGKFPAIYSTELADEGILLSDEGLSGSTTYRNFHRPGSYSGYRKVGCIASVVVTNKRITAYSGENPLINVPFTDERLKQIAFSVDPGGAVLAAFDAPLFHSDWSRQIEYRFRTPLGPEIVDQVHSFLHSGN